jgi:hypothetical protein
MHRFARAPLFVGIFGLAVLGAVASCDPTTGSAPGAEADTPDATLRTHAVEPSTPTPEGLAYIQTMARVHQEADAASGPRQKEEVLRGALAQPVPAGLGEAEILRLDVAARLSETLMEQPDGAAVACDILEPMLEPRHSLPMDRATARALVVLGDAARQTGDDALAAGSYMRAIRMMSLLRQELEQ